MNVALLLGVAVGVAAPGLKDPPKKGGEIVGEWLFESMTMAGKDSGKSPQALRYEFTSDGQWNNSRDGTTAKSAPREYKLDPKANPPSIDITNSTSAGAAAKVLMSGIYKVDGDTLTLCFAVGGDERPKVFESPEGSRDMLMVFKRVKKKD